MKKFYLFLIFINFYWATQMTKRNNFKVNNFFSKFYHEPGTICDFGVIMGKIGIILILVEFILIKKYPKVFEMYKKYILILLYIFIFLSFMNIRILLYLLPAFYLQYNLIYY